MTKKGTIVAAGNSIILDFNATVKTIKEKRKEKGMVFVMEVDDPSSYGVAVCNRNIGTRALIEESIISP